MSEQTIDLGIAGGGPAGSMAAIEAARSGLKVALWERGSFPRDKVCGEFLSPEALPLLRQVIPGAIYRSVTIRRAEFCSKGGRRHSIGFPAPGAGLSRRVLDHALWQAAAGAGACCHSHEALLGAARQSPGRDSGWDVIAGTGKAASASRFIVACGRWWKLTGLPSPAAPDSRQRACGWLGAKAHFKGVDASDAVEMYFFPGGYCGLAPVEDGAYNACCLVHRSLAESCRGGDFADFRVWISKVARHPALNSRLYKAVQVSPTLSTAPVNPARQIADSSGILIAGDAAGFLDPFTGDGISMALHSGQLAARQLVSGLKHRGSLRPACLYRRQFSQSVRRSYLCAALLRTIVRAPAELQDWLTAAMPSFLASRLLSETRWRDKLR